MYLKHLLRYGQAEPASVQAAVMEAGGDVTLQLCLEILKVPAPSCWHWVSAAPELGKGNLFVANNSVVPLAWGVLDALLPWP